MRHELDELLDSHLAQAAALLVAQQAGEIEDDDHGINAPSLHRYAPKVAFQVFHEGRLALRSSNAPAEPMIALGGRVQVRASGPSRSGGASWRVFATHGSERDVQVYVGEQVDSRNSILWAVLRSALCADAVGAAAAGARGLVGGAPGRRADAQHSGRTLAQREPQALQPIALRRRAVGDDADAGRTERPVRAHRPN